MPRRVENFDFAKSSQASPYTLNNRRDQPPESNLSQFRSVDVAAYDPAPWINCHSGWVGAGFHEIRSRCQRFRIAAWCMFISGNSGIDGCVSINHACDLVGASTGKSEL